MSYPKPKNPQQKIVYDALIEAGMRYGSGQDWQCPAHDDERESLGVAVGKTQPVIMRCLAGCATADILAALELSKGALSGAQSTKTQDDSAPTIVSKTVYTYTDDAGNPTISVYRNDLSNGKKDFRQGPAGKGVGSVKGIPNHLYSLPAVNAAVISNRIVWLVEGESSAEALIELGEVATTQRMGASQPWPADFSAVLAGATVRVVADFDSAGFKRALTVGKALKKAGCSVTVWRSATEHLHDDIVDHIAAWKSRDQLIQLSAQDIKDQIAAWDETPITVAAAQFTQAQIGGAALWPSPTRSAEVALEYVQRYCMRDGFRTLHFWQDSFYSWDGQKFVRKDVEQVRLTLGRILLNAVFLGEGDDPKVLDWKPNTARLNDVVNMLKDCCYLRREISPGSVLDVAGSVVREPGEAISFPNGMLDLERMELISPTPAFFNHSTVSYEYDSEASEPKVWLDWLKSLWPDDPTAIAALQEWFGYVLSGDTRLQKALFIIGAKRSGKGTIFKVMENMLGKGNYSNPDIFALGDRFGLSDCIGRLAANIGDARFTAYNAQQIVTRLLQATAADGMTIDRKYGQPWTGVMSARFSIATNTLPSYRDSSGAFVSRFLIIQIPGEGFLGREDHGLYSRIVAEPAGVLLWALAGLQRVRLAGKFTEVVSAAETRRDLVESTAPVQVFFEQRMIETDDFKKMSSRGDVFDAWREWCLENEFHPGNSIAFGREVCEAFPMIRAGKRVVNRGGKSVAVFAGWTLANRRLRLG